MFFSDYARREQFYFSNRKSMFYTKCDRYAIPPFKQGFEQRVFQQKSHLHLVEFKQRMDLQKSILNGQKEQTHA